jgi:hydrogenase/urease accessory protein HupE
MWEPRQPEYEQMIVGVYVTLGIFVWLAARNPLQHLSLIWFTAWSSLVHGGIMAVQAVVDPAERANLVGDVPALLIVGFMLAILTPRAKDLPSTAAAGRAA